ncbi:hypothetical protein [Thiofilum sp.]|uniref:hypothetical protein n=1 Tax=Thiofilum sp. TaxID=2212733 RepID=UPI0026002078|nr:hypothetical protein [Thiofilum sp.]
MDLSDGLRDSLKAHLSWGKPRLDCFVGMLHTLLSARQMNLALLAVHIDSDTDIGSRYRRMQRFLAKCSLITMTLPIFLWECSPLVVNNTTSHSTEPTGNGANPTSIS